jgi:AcrR family transcriptional regulator
MTFSPTDLAADARARPDRLITTARALANETGSAAFTVAQVTERSELSLKAFYQCFRGKDDLLLALLTEDSRIGAEVLAERIGNRHGQEAVHAYVIELFDMLSLPGAIGYAGVLVREYLRLVEHHQDELQVALRPLIDLLARNLATSEPRRDAITMFGVLLGGVHELVVGRGGKPRELAEYLYRFCARGVLGQ